MGRGEVEEAAGEEAGSVPAHDAMEPEEEAPAD